jgi:ABC-type branched-subunit amino acid transport system substrate-binding protein
MSRGEPGSTKSAVLRPEVGTSRGRTLIGALVPLSRPAWLDAGRHLLAGLKEGVAAVNAAGGLLGAPVELMVADTSGGGARVVEAMSDMALAGVAGFAGEYHSVVARQAATMADTLQLPFLCSSAVLDHLTERPSEWVARIAPRQSRGWRIYADFLVASGHVSVALAVQRNLYWSAGAGILRERLSSLGTDSPVFDVDTMSVAALCDAVALSKASAVLVLAGHPQPAIAIVEALRADRRLDGILIGAPAGQPEFEEWVAALAQSGSAIPFLRYLPDSLTASGFVVEARLRKRLDASPSFVAFEGYDTVISLAEALRNARANSPEDVWSPVVVEGTRGTIRFTRPHGATAWEWADAPIQVVDRDPLDSNRFRILRSG